MCREIKFRAWYHDGNGNGAYQYSPRLIENEWWVQDTDGEWRRSNCVVIEQYTGLKDKNGVEGYSGDLFFIDGEWYEVVWIKLMACFALWPVHNQGLSPLVGTDIGSEIKRRSIEGNIHQHPELVGG